jgi:hypothetical protein
MRRARRQPRSFAFGMWASRPPPFRVDVLQSIEGKEFEVAWANKIQ